MQIHLLPPLDLLRLAFFDASFVGSLALCKLDVAPLLLLLALLTEFGLALLVHALALDVVAANAECALEFRIVDCFGSEDLMRLELADGATLWPVLPLSSCLAQLAREALSQDVDPLLHVVRGHSFLLQLIL